MCNVTCVYHLFFVYLWLFFMYSINQSWWNKWQIKVLWTFLFRNLKLANKWVIFCSKKICFLCRLIQWKIVLQYWENSPIINIEDTTRTYAPASNTGKLSTSSLLMEISLCCFSFKTWSPILIVTALVQEGVDPREPREKPMVWKI